MVGGAIGAWLLGSAMAWAMGTAPPPIPYFIRVAVVQGAGELQMAIRGPYEIRALYTDEVLLAGRSMPMTRLEPSYSGVVLGREALRVVGVRIVPGPGAQIIVNGARFRGTIEIVRQADLTLLAVNHVNIDDYLYGVLYREMKPEWPAAALEAQAIAARTYAIFRTQERAGEDFDVTADARTQVYSGATWERRRTSRAVNRTQGLVLTYGGQILPAYYSSTCGGHTEAAHALWKTRLSPLAGVPCNYCFRSPFYRWSFTMSAKDLAYRLRKAGRDVGAVRALRPDTLTPTGRVKTVRVVGATGQTLLPAQELRQLVGTDRLRSTKFSARLDGAQVVWSGEGWGHGVGLCQWGALELARRGWSAEQILHYYYPGAAITMYVSPDAPGSDPS